jgi:hypothetical protein
LGFSIGAIKARLITLDYPSLAQFDFELQLMIANTRHLCPEDPVAEEHCQAVAGFLEIYKVFDQWASYDSKHQPVASNPPTGN